MWVKVHFKSINRTKTFRVNKKTKEASICVYYDPYTGESIWETYNSLDEAKYYYVLAVGYKSDREKLNDWFWGPDQEVDPKARKVLVNAERAAVRKERKEYRKMMRERYKSKRVMKNYDGIVKVVYTKSDRVIPAKYRIDRDLVIIEPQEPNTAAFIINRKDFEENEVIELSSVDYIRVVHRGKNIEVIKGEE